MKKNGPGQPGTKRSIARRNLFLYLVSGMSFVSSKFAVKYNSGGVKTLGVLLDQYSAMVRIGIIALWINEVSFVMFFIIFAGGCQRRKEEK